MDYKEFMKHLHSLDQEAYGPTQTEYQLIEQVYTFYPSMSNIEGKKQIAWLYYNLGMAVIYDMLPRAKKAYECEIEIGLARFRLSEAERKMEQLRRNPLPDSCLQHNLQPKTDDKEGSYEKHEDMAKT